MIIFDEKYYAEKLLVNGYKNEKYITFDNIILVKYWKYLGITEDKIKENLFNFMSQFQNLYNDDIIKSKINKAIKVGMKYDLLYDVVVNITTEELLIINKLNNIILQKMMFIFLVVWKFKGKPERFRISNTDIMKLANINVNNQNFWDYIYQLTQSELLSMVEYKAKSYYKVNFDSSDNSEIVLTIDNFNNIIEQYLSYLEPDKCGSCVNCGVPILISNNRTKYCRSCWEERERELWRENKRKIRNVQV